MVVEVIPEGLLTAKRPVSGTCFGVLVLVAFVMEEEVESFEDKAMRDLHTMITTNGKSEEKEKGGKLVAQAFYLISYGQQSLMGLILENSEEGWTRRRPSTTDD